MSQEGGTDEEEEDDEGSHSTSLPEECPPLVTIKNWKRLVGKALKKPAAEKRAVWALAKSLAKKALQKGWPAGPGKELLSAGAEKSASPPKHNHNWGGYLQHVLGLGKNKRPIASVILSQTGKTTKTHQQLVELSGAPDPLLQET